MGLELVEIMMEVEEKFGIEIQEDEAQRIFTAGELYACILNKIGRVGGPCLSSRLFYRMRRVVMELFDASRGSVTPRSRLEGLIPARARRRHWQALSGRLGLRLPRLRPPLWVEEGIIGGTLGLVVVGILGLFAAEPIGIPLYVPAVLVVAAGAFCWASYKAAAPFSTRIPADCATVRGTIGEIMSENYGRFYESERRRHEEPIWHTVKAVILEQTGADPDEITPDSRFYEDLHMG